MTEVYARAMEAVEQQRFQVAVNLLQVCVDTEPHPLEAAVEYIVRLASVAHAATVERAQPVLARARDEGNRAACARVMVAVSNYHYYEGEFAPSLIAIDEALALLDGAVPTTVQAIAMVRRIELAVAAREFDVGQRLTDRLMALARQLGSDRLVALALRNQAHIAQLCGEPERALRDVEHAVELGRALRLRNADLATALLRWATLCRGAGQLARALPLIDEAARHAVDSGMPMRAAHALAAQASIAAAAGQPEVAEAALVRLRSHAIMSNQGGLGLLHLAEGAQAWRARDHERALESFEHANVLLRHFDNFWFEFALVFNAGLSIAASRFGPALRFIEEYEAHPRFGGDRWLQAQAHLLRATLAHAQGARAEARHALRAALAQAPAGLVRAQAQLAAVWLACEDGALEPVPGWLAELGEWTNEHPDGLAALARYRYACGDFAAAQATQAAYVEHWPASHVSDAQRRLLAAYRTAQTSGRAVEVERLLLLPASSH
jgi:tetratricopeptide (TPR) repeat protein